MQKQVKIIGLSINEPLGILNACEMSFTGDKLIKIKGRVGQGKSTLRTALELGTKGSSALTDKNLYGTIDTETQLLDGQQKIYVGSKTDKNGKLVYTLYTKDDNGKIIREPVIDGVKATPAKYLEALQTELTWRMDELVSENTVVQRKILLDLYKHDLIKSGVIFDTKHPDYSTSILGKIDIAVKDRDLKDMLRKQKGGIKEDLKAKGFDPERPATIPDYVDIASIDEEINRLTNDKTLKQANVLNEKENALKSIKNKADLIYQKAHAFNDKLKVEYQLSLSKHENEQEKQKIKQQRIDKANEYLNGLKELGYLGNEVDAFISGMPQPEQIEKPKEPEYIKFSSDGQMMECDNDIYKELVYVRKEYQIKEAEQTVIDTCEIDTKIDLLKQQKENGEATNLIVSAVDSYYEWKKADDNVQSLRSEYYSLLAGINTGVEGLKIICEETTGDIFLKYDGSFNPEYFSNHKKELRKLSSYSGTQKPLICLLIQHYQLSKKPKALRYMYIDNVPMDKMTQEVLLNMCDSLNITVFLTITGDFDKDTLQNGEILIEGGEVFFNE